MGSSAQAERRHVPRRPFRGTVELAMPEDAEAYEADGVDLSIGGMSLRTSLLPDRGSELACRFKLEDGRRVHARGEVVWAQDAGSDAGEFGLRFTELSDTDEDAIRGTFEAEAAADDAAEEAPREPAKARLHIPGMSAPLRARIRTEMDDAIVLGSDLSFLKLGEVIELERSEGKRERGRIEDVTIEVDDETRIARLMLTVAVTSTGKTARYGAVSAPAAAAALAPTVAPVAKVTTGPNATAMLSPAPDAEVDAHHDEDEDSIAHDDTLAVRAHDRDDEESQVAEDDEEAPAEEIAARGIARTPPAWLVSTMATLRAFSRSISTKAGPAIGSFLKTLAAYLTLAVAKIRSRVQGTPMEVEAPRTVSGRRPQVAPKTRVEPEVATTPRKKLGLYVLAGAGLVAIVFAVATSGKSPRPRTPRPQVAIAPAAEAAPDPAATPGQGTPEAVDPNAQAAGDGALAAGEPAPGSNTPVVPSAAVAGQNFDGPDDMTARPRAARRSTAPIDLAAAAHSRMANTITDRPSIRGASSGPQRVVAAPAAAAPAHTASTAVATVLGSPAVRTGTVLRMRVDGPLAGIAGGVGAGNTIVIRMPGHRSLDLAAPLVRQDARLVNAGVYNRTSGAELTLRFRDAVPAFQARARGNTLEIVLAPTAVRTATRTAPTVAAHRR